MVLPKQGRACVIRCIKMVNVRLPVRLWLLFKAYSESRGLTLQAAVEQALKAFMKGAR